MYKKSKNYTVPLYDFLNFRIIISNRRKKLKHKFGIKFPKNTASCLYSKKQISLVLNIEDFTEKNIYGVLAHECIHAKNYIFRAAGIKTDVNNDEPEAYLVDWLMNKTVKFINKHYNI